MKISFEFDGYNYRDWDISIPELRQQLESKGIDLVPIAKSTMKKQIDDYTQQYISDKFAEKNEELSDIVSEQSVLEGKFFLAGIQPEQVRNSIFEVVVGAKTVADVITQLSIPPELETTLNRAIEIAKMIYWKEQIWEAEATLEAQVDTMTLDELLSLDVKSMCETAYESIVL